jgi:hypothetical protein
MKYITLGYFARSLIDPLFEVFEVLDNQQHPEHDNLLSDIESINTEDLSLFIEQYPQYADFFNHCEDKEFGKRAYYLVFDLQKEIANERIRRFTQFDSLPEPYNSQNLLDVELDKNYLISTNYFDLEYQRLQVNDFVYELSPVNRASNSNYWIFQAILQCVREAKVSFKLRLDPFIEIRADSYQPMMYKMLVHGKPLDWEKLSTLRNEDFGQWFNETDTSFTDYTWAPKDDEIHFTCEEYPSHSYDGITTSRYFHAIFNKLTGGIKHCDGAIRVYDDLEIESRRKFHIRQAEVRKVGKRIKIFQFEGKDNQGQELSRDNFSLLAVNFFVWNDDVQNYFNA